MAVAAAGDEHTIAAVLRARAEGIAQPVLVGDKAEIDSILEKLGQAVPADDIYDVPDAPEAARRAVELVRTGKAHFLMKGRMDTSVLLKAVVDKEHDRSPGHSQFNSICNPQKLSLAANPDSGRCNGRISSGCRDSK